MYQCFQSLIGLQPQDARNEIFNNLQVGQPCALWLAACTLQLWGPGDSPEPACSEHFTSHHSPPPLQPHNIRSAPGAEQAWASDLACIEDACSAAALAPLRGVFSAPAEAVLSAACPPEHAAEGVRGLCSLVEAACSSPTWCALRLVYLVPHEHASPLIMILTAWLHKRGQSGRCTGV